uniref:Uncharacterized protein n=1 Tax=Timema cristinae TaxID=61476 RepID=A0A7R9CFV6_TIMCR|nr:unnamed protein product [Timema cristinae]
MYIVAAPWEQNVVPPMRRCDDSDYEVLQFCNDKLFSIPNSCGDTEVSASVRYPKVIIMLTELVIGILRTGRKAVKMFKCHASDPQDDISSRGPRRLFNWGREQYLCVCDILEEDLTKRIPDWDLNLNLPVVSSLLYCESSTLDHVATKISVLKRENKGGYTFRTAPHRTAPQKCGSMLSRQFVPTGVVQTV